MEDSTKQKAQSEAQAQANATASKSSKHDPEQLRQKLRSMSDKERADVLTFLVGYYRTSATVLPDTREFWQNLTLAIDSSADPNHLRIHPNTADTDKMVQQLKEKMDRFNQLLNGPMAHPLLPFRLTRMQNALFTVAVSCPEAWENLERYCRQREQQDREQLLGEVIQ